MASTRKQSRLHSDIYLNDKEAIFHIVGNDRARAVFIEYFDSRFDLYSASFPADLPLEKSETPFICEVKLKLNVAKTKFSQSAYYYFGYCLSKNDIQKVTKHFDITMRTLSALDVNLNLAFNHLIPDTLLFDKHTAEPISNLKTKYDTWLEKWNEPLTDHFKTIENEDSRRLLQLLQYYSGNGMIERLRSFHPKRHHRDEINAVIAPYKSIISLESSVKRILRELKKAIEASEEKNIKTRGDLFALLGFIKDQTGIDYFNLKPKSDIKHINEKLL